MTPLNRCPDEFLLFFFIPGSENKFAGAAFTGSVWTNGKMMQNMCVYPPALQPHNLVLIKERVFLPWWNHKVRLNLLLVFLWCLFKKSDYGELKEKESSGMNNSEAFCLVNSVSEKCSGFLRVWFVLLHSISCHSSECIKIHYAKPGSTRRRCTTTRNVVTKANWE